MSDPVEFVPIGDGTSVSVGGISIRGYESVSRTGGQQAPTAKTEPGYEFTSRVGAKAIEAEITGWVGADDAADLARLERRREAITANAPSFSLAACVVDKFEDEMPGDYPGAHEITLSIREIQQASTGTTTIQTTGSAGTKTPEPGFGGLGGGGSGPSIVHTSTGTSAPIATDSTVGFKFG